jgi:4-amino-4-deoxy-L-arabinose transferase-like glycosyltransferase
VSLNALPPAVHADDAEVRRPFLMLDSKYMPARQQKRRVAVKLAEVASQPVPPTIAFLERHARPAVLVLILFASVRIVSTYTVFNHTSDEPNHIACGMEWLDKGTYTYEAQHPPLARVAAALGPYLLGIRSQGPVTPNNLSVPEEGTKILYRDRHYDLTLALARLGILPFFWIACLVMYWWGKRYFGATVAVVNVFLFSFLPPVLAHAGLATTDMALTAFLGAAFVSVLVWLERPSPLRGALFGVCTALAMLSKFSVVAFLPASLAVALIWLLCAERPTLSWLAAAVKRRLPSFGLAVLVGLVVIWAGYRFSFGKTDFTSFPLPAPEVFSGIRAVMRHNATGHAGYLLGERNITGFWYYYPVVLAVKTPLAFLFLLGYGVVLALRKRSPYRRAWIPVSFAAGILLVGLQSHINIGVRHILPIYLAFSIPAAIAALRLLELSRARKWMRIGLALLVVWFAGSSLLAHPDYLPYFNELAGSEPEKIVADSDLDWGQDMKRLAKQLHEAGARELTFNQYVIADLEHEHGFPPIHEMDLANPSPGWNAVSLTYLKVGRLGLWYSYLQVQPWPEYIKPTERVGKGILLWYFPYPGEKR